MKKYVLAIGIVLGFVMTGVSVQAQEAVVASSNPDALFTSSDPKLHANKQVAYKIILELLEAGHWDKASQYLTDDYIQHNPNAQSGLKSVVAYFTEVLKVQPKPIPPKISMKVADVVAEGDLVVVTYARTEKDPKDPSRTYSTTWFDMWRIQDGKAAEHWDSALLNEAPNLR
ncbi:nuclear transport factor 2 family protein [Agrobacterium tumefaciens]|uniref:nuclear transport factor 2 family protein n=2 Tax=Agrobacterium tumefaciens TaxID=358 RepID=UPI001F39A091